MGQSRSTQTNRSSGLSLPSGFSVPVTSIHKVDADGVRVFYRAAGDANAPVVLLLHGFPASSFMFRDLIPRLAGDYRVIAPDLPGFGFTEVPEEREYIYSFDRLAATLNAFTQALKIRRYALYVFDYGAPTGFRLAMAHPERVSAIISQNGNAYEEGLADAWAPIRKYWAEPSLENREVLCQNILNFEGTRWQYTHGVASRIAFHLNHTHSTRLFSNVQATKTYSSIYFGITPRTLNSIRRFKIISGKLSRHSSRFGERTTHSSFPRGPRPFGVTCRPRESSSWIPAILRWRRTSSKLPPS